MPRRCKDRSVADISQVEETTTDARRIERFDRLWDECYARVLGYALRRTDPEDARETAAEVFTVAWRRLEDVPQDAELPWLLATSRRTLANRRRAAAKRPIADGAEHAARFEPDPAERVAARAALARAFTRLSEDDREALMLLAWDGLQPREAAVVLGCSAATFSVRVHRARGRLASFLSFEDEPDRERSEEASHDGS